MAGGAAPRVRREKLSIYLVKAGYGSDDRLLKLDNADEPIALNLGDCYSGRIDVSNKCAIIGHLN